MPSDELDEAPINLPAPEPRFTPHDRYAWPIVEKALNDAGWMLVRKPELRDKGKNAAQKK